MHTDTESPLLSSPCSILGQSLWRPYAHLYPDYIELTGWRWTGRTTRRIALTRIEHIRWWGGKRDVNFELTLHDGAFIALYLHQSAGTWNYTLRRLKKQERNENVASPAERALSNRVGIPTS